jgi:hypothetical protein
MFVGCVNWNCDRIHSAYLRNPERIGSVEVAMRVIAIFDGNAGQGCACSRTVLQLVDLTDGSSRSTGVHAAARSGAAPAPVS